MIRLRSISRGVTCFGLLAARLLPALLIAALLGSPLERVARAAETGAEAALEPGATTTEAASVTSPAARQARFGLWGPRYGGRRFELRVFLDYASATTEVYGLRLDPFSVGLGFSLGYTTPHGLGFGLMGDIYKGRTISQVYAPPLTVLEIPIDAQSQMADLGAFVSYDQPLGPVALRYSLGLALGFLSWDFGDLPYTTVAGFSPMQGTLLAPNLDPALGVFWPIGFLVTGAQVHYRVPLSGSLPASMGGAVSLGVRF